MQTLPSNLASSAGATFLMALIRMLFAVSTTAKAAGAGGDEQTAAVKWTAAREDLTWMDAISPVKQTPPSPTRDSSA